MSKDSSKSNTPVVKQPLEGWSAAVMSVLAALGVYLFVPIVAAIILVLYKAPSGYSVDELQNWLDTSIMAQFFYVLIVETITVVIILYLIRLFRWSWKTIGLTRPSWYDPLLGLAAAVPYFVVFIVLSAVSSYLLPGFDPSQEQQVGFDAAHQTWQLALTFVGLVILAPLAEEIVFRGFLYSGLKKWLPRLVAVFVVSLLFALPHLGGSADGWSSFSGLLWVAGLDTFILSLFLIGLREYTGNLWASITLHATKNFVGFVFLFLVIS